MKPLILIFAISYITIASSTASAADKPNVSKPTAKPLILAIDTKVLASSTIQHSFQPRPSIAQGIKQTSFKPSIDGVSNKVLRAKKAFSRLTTMRYRKGEKIRAKIGKKSLTLRYIRTL